MAANWSWLDRLAQAQHWEIDALVRQVSAEELADREFVRPAVERSGAALRFAAVALRSDRPTVLAAVKQDCMALRFASEALRGDPEIVDAAFVQSWMAFQFVPRSKQTKETVVAALRAGMPFSLVGVKLKEYKEVVLAAVEKNGLWLADIDGDGPLACDVEIVLAAVRQNALALEHVVEALQHDPIVAAAREALIDEWVARVDKGGLPTFKQAPRFLRISKRIVLALVSFDGFALSHVPSVLTSDRDVLIRAVEQNGLALEVVPFDRRVKEVVLAAVKQNPQVFRSVSHEMQADMCVAKAFFGEAEVEKEKTELLVAVANDVGSLAAAPNHLLGDLDVMRAAVEASGDALQYALPHVASDKDIVMCAIARQAEQESAWMAEDDASHDQQMRRKYGIAWDALKHDSQSLHEKSQEELEAALPHVREADDILRQLGLVNLHELKAFRVPPKGVPEMMSVVGLLLQGEAATWPMSKRMMYDISEFHEKLNAWRKRVEDGLLISRDVAAAEALLNTSADLLTYDVLRLKSEAAAILCTWAKCVIAYYHIFSKSPVRALLRARCLADGVERPWHADSVLRHASSGLRDDEDVVMAAVACHGAALLFASDRLRGCRRVATLAVECGGKSALRHVRPPLSPDDPELRSAAIPCHHILLTIFASPGAEGLDITCTNIGGEELHSSNVREPEAEVLRSYRARICEHLSLVPGRLKLMLQDGSMLDEAKNELTLASLFGDSGAS